MRLGTWMAFAQGPEALAFFTGVPLSDDTVRRLTETAGQALVAVEEAEVTALEERRLPAPVGPAIQQLRVDGAMVPLVGGQWGEVKLLAVGTVTAATDGGAHTTDRSSFARLTDAETFSRLATGETHRRGTERAGQVAAVLDGAVWQQGFVDLHRPDAVRILDFPHAAQHVSAAVSATLGLDTPATRVWLTTHRHALKHGDPADVLEAVACLPTAQAPDPAAAATAVRATLDYLAARWEQIQSASFLAQGLPIGSGAVASGHKVVMPARLKGPGMHWAPRNVNPMLALRGAACHDRWAVRWAALSQQGRTTIAVRRRLRFLARHAPPPPPPRPVRPKRVVAGRPTADHPWKRRPLLAPRRRVA